MDLHPAEICAKQDVPATRNTLAHLDVVALDVGLLYAGDDERRRLTGPILGAGEEVAALQHDGDGLLLDGRRPLKALFVDAHQKLPVAEAHTRKTSGTESHKKRREGKIKTKMR